MKKWITIILLLVIVLAGAVYFFIPTRENFTYRVNAACKSDAATRLIINKDRWKNWWPGQQKNDTVYSYKHYDYKINTIYFNGFEATVTDGRNLVSGLLQVISEENNNTVLQWATNFVYSPNLVTRLLQYGQAGSIKTNIKSLLGSMKDYFDKEENVYGFKVTEQKVTDSSLISLKQKFSHYPTTQEVYSMINSLKGYINKKGGEAINPPMLNVHTDDSVNFETMVAIPVKKDLPSEGIFQQKKMILGNILVAEVKGGASAVAKDEMELRNYLNDFRRSSPAIPYQSLVTDRLRESDSSKWVTRWYYPVFK